MGTTFRFRSGDQARPADVSQIACLLGTCADGEVGATYALDPGADVAAVLGPGRLTAMVIAHHAATGKRCVAVPVAPTYAALPVVVQSGEGPPITIEATDAGASDSARVVLTVTADGTAFDVSYDGTSVVETMPIPREGPAVVRGTVDLSSSVPAMDTLTLVFTEPTSHTITFTSSPDTPAALVAAFNELADAAPLAVHARVHEATTGAQYLELVSTAVGEGAHVTISASSTGETTLGLGTTQATGAPATRVFEWLGFEATIPTPDEYVPGETYTIALTGPRGSVSAYGTALDAAIDSYHAHPFGFVTLAEELATNANARTLYDALRATAATKRADQDDPVLFDLALPTAMHAASATRSTNDTAIAAFDADLLTAFEAAARSLETIVVGDCYVSGPPALPGTFRRPATWAACFKRATLDRVAGNLCDGTVDVTLRAADGVTWARDDARSATRLAGLGGAGFAALKSMGDGQVKFGPAATRAGPLDRYRNPGVVAIALAMCRAILPQLQAWEGTWETDEERPTAVSSDQARHREGVLEELIAPVAFPTGKPRNVTKVDVAIDGATVLDDGHVGVTITFNPLAVAEAIVVTVVATGVQIVTQGEG